MRGLGLRFTGFGLALTFLGMAHAPPVQGQTQTIGFDGRGKTAHYPQGGFVFEHFIEVLALKLRIASTGAPASYVRREPVAVRVIQLVKVRFDGVRHRAAGFRRDFVAVVASLKFGRIDAPLFEMRAEPRPAAPVVSAPYGLVRRVFIIRRMARRRFARPQRFEVHSHFSVLLSCERRR